MDREPISFRDLYEAQPPDDGGWFSRYVIKRPVRLLPDLKSAYLRLWVLGLVLILVTPGWGRVVLGPVTAWEFYDWWRLRRIEKIKEGRYRDRVDCGADVDWGQDETF